ncbi:hypothetical protein P8452_35579 [Trifolium repens]|nr:hypothetical protein P8452_35579 [Trifolium repens]
MWNKTTTCCNWSGVTCDNNGHVISLDLSGEHIVAGFNNSSSLFSLIHLQKLNLGDNYFNSSIPSGFSKLKKLTYLNLSKAGFVGQIPAEVSQLKRLVTLDLSFISYSTKPQIPNLQKFVQNLTKIRKLYLDDISITSQGHEWSNALLPLRGLQEVSMYNCDLSGPLDSSLAKLENLSVIILDGNNFSSPIPETFATFKNLTTLTLSDCGLIGTFPQKIFQIEKLTILDISFNLNLQGSFPEFPLNGSIHTLLVAFTSFSGVIPRTIDNQIQGKIPTFIWKLPYLQVLNISHNFLSVMEGPSQNLTSNLRILDISFNNIYGTIPPSLITMTSTLLAINLMNNKFNGVIPDMFPTTCALGTLNFHGNLLHGPIPQSLSHCSSLEDLRPHPACGRQDCSNDRNFLNVELGFVLGLGIIICPIMFWKKWRIWYWKLVDKILCWIFSRMYLEYATDRGKTYTILRWQYH